LAESLLTSGKETSVGPSLLYLDNLIRSVLNDGMLDLVRNGPPPPKSLNNENVWKAGVQAMLNQDRCGRAQRIASFVASLPEFSSFKRMLDIGAGSGIMSIAIATAHPSLRCFLMDRPAVCSIAEKVVAEYDMHYRIQAIRGDYMKDPFGTDYDFIMANYTLNFYRERLGEIVSKAYQALKPGGIFMVTSDAMNREKTSPTSTVMSWLAIWLQGIDMSFERGVVASVMREGGFESTESQILEGGKLDPHIPVEIIIGRKGRNP
jgi:predicted O-methyltransferase YrrM